MIATVDIADLGAARAARVVLGGGPDVGAVAGLRFGQVALFAPLALRRPPPAGRVGLIAFWEDEDAIDRFRETDPLGRRLAGGVHARLRPLRAYGSWPGLPPDVPTARAVPHDGPVVVFTLGRLRLSQTVRFLRTSRPAEQAAVEHPGLVWGSVAVRPPFVATVSVWEDSKAAAGYAYGRRRPAHDEAIVEQQRKDFHARSAFIRFEPLRLEGELGGRNPLPASVSAAVVT